MNQTNNMKKYYLNVHNIERTRMSFPVHDGSNTSSVTASSDHAQVSSLEFDRIHDFASIDVQPKKCREKLGWRRLIRCVIRPNEFTHKWDVIKSTVVLLLLNYRKVIYIY